LSLYVLEIIKNNPFSGDAYLFLSIYYRNIGDIQKAELMLKKSLELDSRYFSSIFLIEELYK